MKRTAIILAAIPLLAAPAAASAHGIVGRDTLPVPGWLFAWAAAAVLAISFFALANRWTTPRLQNVQPTPRLTVPRFIEFLLGLLGVAVFVITIYAGLAGVAVDTANLAPTMIFVIAWVGIPLLSVLFGDIFRAVSPWRAIGRAGGWLATRIMKDTVPKPMPYPERLGRWPAVLGVAAFAWVELVSASRDEPAFLATCALIYAAIQLIGMSLYGERAWTANGDGIGGMFALIGRLSPLVWKDRKLFTAPPLAATTSTPTGAGTVVLLCTMIGSTSFDGLQRTALWLDLMPSLQDMFGAFGLSSSASLQAANTIGLLAAVLFVSGLYRLGVHGIATITRQHTSAEIGRLFAHSLIPIAAAYFAAHYLSMALFQGQALAYLASDPLGHGTDIFGTADRGIDYTFIGSSTIWYLQVGALVGGHVAGLILAHDRAIAIFEKTVAVRSQYWMLGVMISFTSLGLWLLSATAR